MDSRGDGAVRVTERVPLLGIVDSLGIGFEKINAILWILLFPLAVGLFLWRGPHLSAAPAVATIADWYFASLTADPTAGQDSMSILSGGTQLREAIVSIAGDLNLFTFLTFGIGIASRGAVAAAPLTNTATSSLLAIASPLQAFAGVLALQAAGLLLGALYLGLIAQQVRGEVFSASRLIPRVWRYWLSLGSFLLLLGIGVLAAAIPISLVMGLAAAFVPSAAELLLTVVAAAWQMALIWLVLFMFFVVDAVVVAEHGPLRAARVSLRLVGRYFWSAGGFILIYLVISYGMIALWLRLGDQPWASVVALVGNAYISSALAAASMVYFRARSAQLTS